MVSLEEAMQYITYYRQQGYSDTAIAQGLYNLGYPPALVQEAFQQLTNTYVPKQSQSSTKTIPFSYFLIGFLVLVFLVGVFGYFLFFSSPSPSSSSQEHPSTTTTSYFSLLTTTTTLPLTQQRSFQRQIDQAKQEKLVFHYRFKFCDYVEKIGNNNILCYPNPYDEFYLGKPIYVYFKPVLQATKQGNTWKVGFVQSRKVYDPSGNELKDLGGTIITYEADVLENGTYSIPAYNKILTNESMLPGDYLLEITIIDKFTHTRDTIKKVISLI